MMYDCPWFHNQGAFLRQANILAMEHEACVSSAGLFFFFCNPPSDGFVLMPIRDNDLPPSLLSLSHFLRGCSVCKATSSREEPLFASGG